MPVQWLPLRFWLQIESLFQGSGIALCCLESDVDTDSDNIKRANSDGNKKQTQNSARSYNVNIRLGGVEVGLGKERFCTSLVFSSGSTTRTYISITCICLTTGYSSLPCHLSPKTWSYKSRTSVSYSRRITIHTCRLWQCKVIMSVLLNASVFALPVFLFCLHILCCMVSFIVNLRKHDSSYL